MTNVLSENPALVVNNIKLSMTDITQLIGQITGSAQPRLNDKKAAVKKLGEVIAARYSEQDAKSLCDAVLTNKVEQVLPTMTKTAPSAAELMKKANGTLKRPPAVKASNAAEAKVKNDERKAKIANGEPLRGKKSSHAGMALTAIKDTNPRREGTHGYKSMEIILKNPGIIYEAFIKKGGRPNDLMWDIERKNVKVSKVAA